MLAENSLNNHFLPFANICTVASFLASYESYTKKKYIGRWYNGLKRGQ